MGEVLPVKTGNAKIFEMPAAPLETVIWFHAGPDGLGAAISAEAIDADSWLLLINVVVRGDPFHSTVEVAAKSEPVSVSVKAAPPAVALVGEAETIAGTPGSTFCTKPDEFSGANVASPL